MWRITNSWQLFLSHYSETFRDFAACFVQRGFYHQNISMEKFHVPLYYFLIHLVRTSKMYTLISIVNTHITQRKLEWEEGCMLCVSIDVLHFSGRVFISSELYLKIVRSFSKRTKLIRFMFTMLVECKCYSVSTCLLGKRRWFERVQVLWLNESYLHIGLLIRHEEFRL